LVSSQVAEGTKNEKRVCSKVVTYYSLCFFFFFEREEREREEGEIAGTRDFGQGRQETEPKSKGN